MILSKKFVQDYVKIPVDIQKLASDMTNIGNEYDSCGPLLSATNLTIGEVLECEMHPNSDHLHVCKVNVGKEVLQIICGAPNVRKGIKVIVAQDGAVLPGGVIKKSKIRGVESNGMLCSIAELGLDHKFLKEKDINGIHEFPSDVEVGGNPIEALGLDDEVIDFELTSNRGDLLSVLGLAYEVGALYNEDVKEVECSYQEKGEDINKHFQVKVQTDACPLFLAKKVNHVVIKESPEFIKNRLIACGIRPINNVVDISNYVMLELGQPLHYYDAERLGDTLVVRQAENGEDLTTLDGQVRTLSQDDIVIANKKEAIGLAGVMGGLSTEVEEDTTSIIIESAIFNAVSIRKTSKKVLRSEASSRFEKGLDPKRTYIAIERSCHLLEKYADATIETGMVEYKKLEIKDKEIILPYEKVNKVLGITISKEEVDSILKRLQFKVERQEDIVKVTVPTRRIDISIPEDLIEEVGRIYGIDKIEGKKLVLPLQLGQHDKTIRLLKNKLADLGLHETLTYSLVSEKEAKMFVYDDVSFVKLLDPMTEERNTLRYSLLPSLLKVYDYNKARNCKDIFLYEVGRGYFKKDIYQEENKLAVLVSGNYRVGLEKEPITFYHMKGIMEEVLEFLGYRNDYRIEVDSSKKELHPGQSAKIVVRGKEVGFLGKLHPNLAKEDIYVMEINLEQLLPMKTKKMQYKEISKYPSIKKDLAFIIPKSVTALELMDVMKKVGGKLLTNIEIFDFYVGDKVKEDEKSIAYSLTFQDSTRTLSDNEVMELFNKIIDEVTKKCHAALRDQ